jgi:uncharacterized cupin superfamily protein
MPTSLEFPGKEVCLYTVELAPGAITPQHRHPGHYFSHVLDGTGVVEEDGKPERSLTPGIVCYTHATADQPVFWHTVWNTSQTRPLRALSVSIIDKGVSGTVFDKS